jgi:nucleoside-diphosphate-sugar epimerase
MLREAGHAVVGLDVAPGADTQILGSVADRHTVERAFTDHVIEAVIHAGGLHKPDIGRHAAQAFIDVNMTGTLHLLQASVAARLDRFVFTSTTSVLISQSIRDENGARAVWLDESTGPLEPRNIYGVSKLAAEGLCRVRHLTDGLNCIVLRPSRFFPEDDDTHAEPAGPNLKANELLHRRLTVEDAARAHLLALERAPTVGFDVLIVSAPTPFLRSEAADLKRDAAAVVTRHFPDAAELYAERGWTLPESIGRVYDATRAESVLGFRAKADFAAVLDALRQGREPPFMHDANYASPMAARRIG